MKKLYRALALSAIAISGPALAADLPSRRAPPVYIPPPVPVFTWTGFYAGGQVGYGWGQDNAVTNINAIPGIAGGALPPGATGLGFYNSRPSGVVGGAHIGYNYEINNGIFGGGLVIGVEGSVDGSDNRSTGNYGIALANAAGVAGGLGGAFIGNTVRRDIEGSARARLGIAVDRALFYVTGGAAFAQFHSSYDASGLLGLGPAGAGLITNLGVQNHTRIGYTVGGGVEYAVTPNWTLRAEYRYTDYGTFTDQALSGLFAAGGLPGGGIPTSHRETDNRVQLGFSYLFSSPLAAPVVARY